MSAKKVQGYLEHHQIGSLFEDLMAKLIKDMPDKPISFLIRQLKKINPEDNIPHSRPPSGSKSSSPMSSGMGLTGKPIARQSLDDSRDFRRNALAKSWAAPDTHSDRPGSANKSREYNRPWLHGSKKGRGEQSQSNKENTRHGMKLQKTDEKNSSWNADTKIPHNDFDEWFEAQNIGSTTTGIKVQDIERKQSWHDHQDFDPSMDKRGIGYPLKINDKKSPQPTINFDDDLEGEEIKLRGDVKTEAESSEGNSVASYSSGRSSKKNAKLLAEEHRRQLQSLLLQSDESTSCRSRHHKLSDEDMDDATELLESSNELEDEGVANATSKGFKLSKALKSGTTDNEPVKVSICARCARIISGLPNDQGSDAASNISNSADEDFESVSQAGSVTGEPARITWPSGFDSGSEVLTPKKGKPMWEKPLAKSQKGKHMYRNSSTFLTDLAASPRPPSVGSDRSDDKFAPRPGKGWQRKHQEYSSDNDTEVNYDRSSPSLSTGRPWNRPVDTGSEAGSEDWTQDRNKKAVNFKSKGFARRGYLDDDSDH